MDSQGRDESEIRRREETLARRVGEALDQANPHGAEECPDAGVIAAYAEQALGPAESAQWEGHFATCARCRKILRVLAASADTPLAQKEVAQLGELVSAVRAPVEITRGSAGRARPRLVDWRTRWLAPALGVAAVLAVWFVMRAPWRAVDRGASETLVAQAPKEEAPLSPAPPERDRLSKIAPQRDQKTDAAPPPDGSSANGQSLNSPVEGLKKDRADAGNALDRISPSADEETNSLKKQEKKLSALSGGREIQTPASPPPPAPLPKAQAAMEAPAATRSEANAALGTPAPAPLPQARAKTDATAPPAPEVPGSTSQSVTVTEAVPLIETTNGALGGAIQRESIADLPLNGRDYQALITISPARESSSSLLKAPTGSILWRAGKSGRIERSVNAGKEWVPQKSPSHEDWLAGAAVSEIVCWLVGRSGAIARTTNGNRWKHIAPPMQAAGTSGKPLDWTGVTASDAQSAAITSADGRHFSTQNGGKTWQEQ
jgi:hypothetical protein